MMAFRAKIRNNNRDRRYTIPIEFPVYQRPTPRTIAKVSIIAREKWGARVPESNGLWVTTPANRIVLAPIETEMCTNIKQCRQLVKHIQLRHMDEGFRDIRYNFVVGNDGNVYEGRGWKECPDLTEEHSEHLKSSLFIGVCGQRNSSNTTQPSYTVKEDLIKYGVGVKLVDKEYTRIVLTE